jgi:bifunctional non-homologous end joining protein LigD
MKISRRNSELDLREYERKRNLEKTKEPEGEAHSKTRNIYVVQKHAATHLHYDLRLEMNGTLKSWAVPKEPPIDSGVKRLAVQVEDHPVEYANFAGTIPKGQYGAGTVEIWDKGTYRLVDKKEDKLIVEISGEKLKGAYVFVRLRDKKNWLLFKKK